MLKRSCLSEGGLFFNFLSVLQMATLGFDVEQLRLTCTLALSLCCCHKNNPTYTPRGHKQYQGRSCLVFNDAVETVQDKRNKIKMVGHWMETRGTWFSYKNNKQKANNRTWIRMVLKVAKRNEEVLTLKTKHHRNDKWCWHEVLNHFQNTQKKMVLSEHLDPKQHVCPVHCKNCILYDTVSSSTEVEFLHNKKTHTKGHFSVQCAKKKCQ